MRLSSEPPAEANAVSMKSGLEGRNNSYPQQRSAAETLSRLNEVRPRRPEQSKPEPAPLPRGSGLNEVRPRRPEQYWEEGESKLLHHEVSMKSGLEGRNNGRDRGMPLRRPRRLNEVRPRRPEQCSSKQPAHQHQRCLNEVRPRRPEQWTTSRRP